MRVGLWYIDHAKELFAHGIRRGFEQAGHIVVPATCWNPNCGPRGWLQHGQPAASFGYVSGQRLSVPRTFTEAMQCDFHLQVFSGDPLWITFEDDAVTHVFWSLEGPGLSQDHAPLKYVAIRAQQDAPAHWLPTGFDPLYVGDGRAWQMRAYDLIQVSTVKSARYWVEQRVMPCLDSWGCTGWMGEVWGPPYWAFYRDARLTWVDPVVPFIPTRVWDAMAAGCVVGFPRNAAHDMHDLFTPGVHYLEYDPVPIAEEYAPDPKWLQHWMRGSADNAGLQAIAVQAQEVVQGHTWRARAERIVADVSALRGGV